MENKAGVGFINEAMRGNLKIVKTSSDGKIKGFAFRITGANGYDIILETNDKGEIFIDELRIGDYTISEVSNSASSMYVLPADKKATVELGSTTMWRCTMCCGTPPRPAIPPICRCCSRLQGCPLPALP